MSGLIDPSRRVGLITDFAVREKNLVRSQFHLALKSQSNLLWTHFKNVQMSFNLLIGVIILYYI